MGNRTISGYNIPEVGHAEVKAAATELILSSSGWRKVFAPGGEESASPNLAPSDRIIIGVMALAFAEAIALRNRDGRAIVAVATDSRPTGPGIADIVIRMLTTKGIEVRFSGVTAVPELLAAVQLDPALCGFAYISASHNPVGYNGLKFGFADGSVAGGEESASLIASFKRIIAETPPGAVRKLIAAADPALVEKVYAAQEGCKRSAYRSYTGFTGLVAAGTDDPAKGVRIIETLKEASAGRRFGVVADFNGSARTTSVDVRMLKDAGCIVETMNDIPGEIAHRIVPEGESLDPCRLRLEQMYRVNPAFCLGYVPDNDGDRGNLVYIDHSGSARALHAQDVFALSCMSELSFLASTSGRGPHGRHLHENIIVANGPTSMRVDRIACFFGAKVERAEVGEANVVNLARALREDGATVRILGEGSAGGTIIHPATCRDPLNTLFSVLKLLLLRSGDGGKGLFEIWCDRSGQTGRYTPDFTLADVLDTLPAYTTTGAYDVRAIMRVSTEDHGLLKARYETLFAMNWPGIRTSLEELNFHVDRWEVVNYEGTFTRRGAGNRDKNGNQRGGLKVLLYNGQGDARAFVWMRGSGTEPVFRILADVEGNRPDVEALLLASHRQLITEADRAG
ncbi:MAG: phosphatidylglycerol lysyltransferase [Spirochaetales bacterium]|nr:phosphatidylglycerol lysyltransferase [Spirochaetales bacterium]